ncbi:hypothetical protein BOTNAR_0458g00100 [Botryotinia narcissicola]|uniref:Geminivirus AL1 replication-associated protein central domain-containing protein n=1 Tax=Botryotinia narcissicola TaxID=278944 RepID=A0A4Z1HJK5_9HELO|nr:hypothetical protein BOTNAR_0458g00100 [Botryotinia narcissicola]
MQDGVRRSVLCVDPAGVRPGTYLPDLSDYDDYSTYGVCGYRCISHGKFRVRDQRLMLTYAQINDTFDKEAFGPWLQEKCKDGDILFQAGPEPTRPKEKQDVQSIWRNLIMSVKTVDEFLEKSLKERPRETILNFTRLRAFAEWKYKPAGTLYQSPEITCHLDKFPGLERWLLEELRGDVVEGGRKKSLVMWGPSRVGKTVWARSLGQHAYFPGMFMLDGFNSEKCDYAIFDDIINGFKRMSSYKGWFGSQKEFIVTDKYRSKQKITWGKPSIFISSEDPRMNLPHDQVQFLEANCVFVHVDSTLCEPV